jgi:hypothetical protein
MGGCCSTSGGGGGDDDTQEKEEIKETTSFIQPRKTIMDWSKTNINKPPIIEIIQPVTPSVDLLKSWDQEHLIRSPELLKRSFLKGKLGTF